MTPIKGKGAQPAPGLALSHLYGAKAVGIASKTPENSEGNSRCHVFVSFPFQFVPFTLWMPRLH